MSFLLVLPVFGQTKGAFVRLGTGLFQEQLNQVEPFSIFKSWEDIKLNRANHDYFHGSIGYRPSSYFQVEALATLAQWETPTPDMSFGLSSRISVPIWGFLPYLHAGITTKDHFAVFAPTFGLGIEARFTNRTSLYLESQHAPFVKQFSDLNQKSFYDQHRLQGGLTVHLGASPKKVAPQKPEPIEPPIVVAPKAVPVSDKIQFPMDNSSFAFSTLSTDSPPTAEIPLPPQSPLITPAVNITPAITPSVSTSSAAEAPSIPTSNTTKSIPKPIATSNSTREPTRNTSNTPRTSSNQGNGTLAILGIEAPSEGIVDQPIAFKAIHNRGRRSVHIQWDFQDGNIREGASMTHVFAQPKIYTITAIARYRNDSDTSHVVIWIKPDPTKCVPPTIQAMRIPTNLQENEPFMFGVEASGSDSLLYNWSFEDEVLSPEANPSRSFRTGKHSVSVQVSNSCGSTTQRAEFQVQINPVCQNIRSLRPAFFSREGMELNASAQSALDANLDQILSCSNVCVIIQGYADANENVLRRSQQRAANVANYFTARGFAESRIRSVNAQNRNDAPCTNTDRRGCRRVEIFPVRCGN
jgi:outer membrane protein OmpA-like peptidoglycan-associated protein